MKRCRSAWLKRARAEFGERLPHRVQRRPRLRRPAELDKQCGTVQQRGLPRGAGQRRGAVVGGQRWFEPAERLEHLAQRIMRLGVFRRRRHRELRGIQRRRQLVELLQHQRLRRQPTGMHRGEGQQGIQPAQGVAMALPRGFDAGQVDVGVGQLRVELDRPAAVLRGLVVVAPVVQQVGQVAVRLGVVRLERQGLHPILLRLVQQAQALAGVAQVVVRLGVVRLQRQHALQAEPAFIQPARLLEDDAEVVPGASLVRGHRHSAAGGLLAVRHQAALAAHLRQVAEIHRRGARRLAGLAQMRDGQVEVAVSVRHDPEQVHGVRLARPDREHLLARHLRLVGLPRLPMRPGAAEGLADVEGHSDSSPTQWERAG